MADRIGSQEVKVKSFDEIMAEKKQRTLQKNNEAQRVEVVAEESQKPKTVRLRTSAQESSRPTTGRKSCFLIQEFFFNLNSWKLAPQRSLVLLLGVKV